MVYLRQYIYRRKSSMCKEGTFGASLHVVVVLFVAAVYTWSTRIDHVDGGWYG